MRSVHLSVRPICPYCGTLLDGATELGPGADPKPGDFGVCIYCGGITRYTVGLGMREASETDLAELKPEQRARVRHTQNMIRTTVRTPPEPEKPA